MDVSSDGLSIRLKPRSLEGRGHVVKREGGGTSNSGYCFINLIIGDEWCRSAEGNQGFSLSLALGPGW